MCIATCFVIITLPALTFLAAFIAIKNNGKIFYRQIRPGKNGALFCIIKFRTMTDLKDEQGNFLPDKSRLTSIGKFLRKTSLDEIPQLLNVIKGEMSLVGPRPLLVEYLPYYNQIQKRRHEVKPGITGWAQVNGRDNISWEEKFNFDVWYVDHISLKLDMQIILRTFMGIFKPADLHAEVISPLPKFRGSRLKQTSN